MDMLCRRCIYPYEFVAYINKLGQAGLPSKEAFCSTLNTEGASDADYQHALNVFKALLCDVFLEQPLGRVETDVLLLADVFWELQHYTCLTYYELEPSNYMSSPIMAWTGCYWRQVGSWIWSAIWRWLSWLEKQARGGLCFVGSKRYVNTSSHCLPDYSPHNAAENCILYADANNLYAWARTQLLSYKDLKFEHDISLREVWIHKLKDLLDTSYR